MPLTAAEQNAYESGKPIRITEANADHFAERDKFREPAEQLPGGAEVWRISPDGATGEMARFPDGRRGLIETQEVVGAGEWWDERFVTDEGVQHTKRGEVIWDGEGDDAA